MSNIQRFENLQQVLKIAEPSFNELAKIHNAVDFRREASFAIQALNDNEYLSAVAMKNQDSFKRAVINVAAIGLTLNPVMGLAYLVPRKNKVCLDISYRGFVSLAVEQGSIKWAVAEVVREKDTFTFQGIGVRPIHDYGPFDEQRGKIIGAYCVAKTNQDELITVHMPIVEIYEIRNRSESWKSGKSSPWKTDEGEMIKKTVIRRARKSWPSASTKDRLDSAIALGDEADALNAPVVVDNFKRSEHFEMIRSYLKMLDKNETDYLKVLCKITRREISCFEELTDIEIDQSLISLSQMIDELPFDEDKNAGT